MLGETFKIHNVNIWRGASILCYLGMNWQYFLLNLENSMNFEPREINIDLIEFISAWILDDLAVIGVYLLNSNYSGEFDWNY